MSYRQLSEEEIVQLKEQQCYSDSWEEVSVDEEFNPDRIHQVRFSGKCRIGRMVEEIENAAGVKRLSGIYNSSIHQSVIGDNVHIANTGLLSNYRIDSRVLIENVRSIAVTGSTSFGNGTELEVLNEGGGRELIIFDRLTAQIAYLSVMHRDDQKLVQAINKMITAYSDEKKSSTGFIGTGSRITNSESIRNVCIGDRVTISGAQLLEEGTIVGDENEQTMIGDGVQARHFIMLSGSVMDQGALADKCFIGQGVRIGKQFSAESSVFFANSEGFHGEAVSLFGGPYTVTHHKSTLLIAGMYSFYNAGSGTNQSNHMYKLGPVHQGIVERGSKTGSFSYLLWPCRVGPFSVVMGKHGSNFDTSDLPFSYITVEGDKSMLTPAMNLLTVGTRRDSEKWPKRDRRKGKEKLDLINFDLLNPYVVSKVINGIDILNELYEKTPKEQEAVNYKGVRIKRLMLKSCRKYYEMAMHIFLGEQLQKRLEEVSSGKIRDIFSSVEMVKGNWADIAGMVLSEGKLHELIEEIKKASSRKVDDLEKVFKTYYDQYDDEAWSWAAGIIRERLGLNLEYPGKDQLIHLIEAWKTNSLRLNNMILSDAKKEFDPSSRIGFGAGGTQDRIDADFAQVRGNFEDNSFVRSLQDEIGNIEKKADHWIAVLNSMK